MQRYFAGDLRADQQESWKAADGIFCLYADYLPEIEAKYQEVEALTYEVSVQGLAIGELKVKIAEKDRQITALQNDNTDRYSKIKRLEEENAGQPCQIKGGGGGYDSAI